MPTTRRAVTCVGATALLCCFASSSTQFATTPVQIDMTTYTNADFFYFDPTAPVGQDADVAAMHDDFYGVPWNTFMYNSTPPETWLARLNATKTMLAGWKKPVFLTLQLGTGPLRSCPASNATDGPGGVPVILDFAGCTSCFEWDVNKNPYASTVIDAYARYVLFYVEQVQPKYLNFAAEINLPQRLCPDQWDGLVAAVNQIYAVVKQFYPDIIAFPSLQLEVVMGLQTGPDQACVGLGGGTPQPSQQLIQCIEQGLQLVAPLNRDAFAVSTYPHVTMAGYPSEKPHWEPWYFPVVFDRLTGNDKANIIFAETGYLSTGIVVNLANGSTPMAALQPQKHSMAAAAAAQAEIVDVSTLASEAKAAGLTAVADPPVECATLLQSNITEAAKYLTYVIETAKNYSMPLVTWWSDMDLLYTSTMESCPCDVPNPKYQGSCTFISAFREIYAQQPQSAAWMGEINAKAFATMGLRTTIDGTDNTPLLDIFQAARGNGATGSSPAGTTIRGMT